MNKKKGLLINCCFHFLLVQSWYIHFLELVQLYLRYGVLYYNEGKSGKHFYRNVYTATTTSFSHEISNDDQYYLMCLLV